MEQEIPSIDVESVKNKIDVGIITIREDEFAALLQHFPIHKLALGRRYYNLSYLNGSGLRSRSVALIHCSEQGGGEAQSAAQDLLDELGPQWLLIVGIAGGRPSSEFALGDVIISTRVHDFSVEALLQNGEREYNLGGGPLHPQAAAVAANIQVLMHKSQWNSPEMIAVARPKLVVTEDLLNGPNDWKNQARDSLSKQLARSTPQAVTGPIASSDRLLRDPEVFQVWLKMARHVFAVEMESAGVYRAAHGRQIPFLAIRGISDIVGLKRDDSWKIYACQSAAAFAHDFLLKLPIKSCRWVLVLDGQYDQFTKTQTETIARRLVEILHDASLTIVKVDRGSVCIQFQTSFDSFEQIKDFFERGELNQILGFKVLDLKYLGDQDKINQSEHQQLTPEMPRKKVSADSILQENLSPRSETDYLRGRQPSEIINQAISENKATWRLLYTFASLVIVIGLSVLVWAIVNQQRVAGIVGFLIALLFWPAFNLIRKTQKEDLAIRILEVPLNRADTAKRAADLLSDFFKQNMGISGEAGSGDSKPTDRNKGSNS